MKKTFKLLHMTIISAAIAAVFGIITVGAAGNGGSANGQGAFTDDGGGLRTFAFNAVTREDGSVTGEAVLHNRDQDTFFKVEINCLQIQGNMATISGFIKNSTVPGIEGQNAVFRVVDNGEGNGNPPDLVSRLLITDEQVNCRSQVGFGLHNVERGNIQVKQ